MKRKELYNYIDYVLSEYTDFNDPIHFVLDFESKKESCIIVVFTDNLEIENCIRKNDHYIPVTICFEYKLIK